jgi:hypothetical protein
MTLSKGQIITIKIREHAYGYSPVYLEPGETVTVVNPKTPAVSGGHPYFAYCERTVGGKLQRFGIFPDNVKAIRSCAPLGRSKAAAARRADIQFHSDNATGCNARPAINVKIQQAPYVDAPEHITAAAWDEAAESFWKCAGTLAIEHGYSGVFSEGRSNGWLVPYTQHDAAGKLVTHWTGQGPGKGYPIYPNVEDKTERRQFIKFRESIEKLLRESLAYYVELAGELAAEPGPAAAEGQAR